MKLRAIVLLSICFSFSSELLATEFTFGIVPQQSSKKLARLWSPVLQKLSADTGITLKFATAKDIPTFEKRLADGLYDFAYMNPYHFTVYNESPGYLAMAHQSNKRIKGIVVVRKDSPMTQLEELDGTTLAFPSPAAFAATILPTANLKNREINFDSKFVSSHDSVYLAVSRGLLPAGGGIVRTFQNTDPAVRDSLKILWTSDGYTPHAFAAHPRISTEDRLKMTTALAELSSTEQGKLLLSSLNMKALIEADNEQWNDVRALQITELEEVD